MKYTKWFLVICFILLPSIVFGQTSIFSTRVNESLKQQLDINGKWKFLLFSDGSTQTTAYTGVGGGDVVGPSASVDSEIVLYNSTTGKLLKRFAGTGIVTATSGVIGTATTTGTGAIVLAVSPSMQTPTITDGAIFNLLSNNNITIDASTNPRTVTSGVVRINHTPGIVGTRPLTLNIDAAGFGDTHAISTDFIATGIGAGEQSHLFDINVNTANSTGGELNGFSMAKTGTGAIDCNAVEVYQGVGVITQRTGVETAIEQAFSYNGAYTDITSNLSSAASDVQLFVANGDIVYIGNATTFNSLAVTLAVAASGAGIKPTFEYSAGASSWTAFSPTDGTNGFRNIGGTIAWGTLAGWATDTVNAVGSKYWIRITRTQNSLTTPPTEDLIKYINSVNYGWDKDGKISAATLNSLTCTAQTNGFTIAGGTTSKTLTVPLDASVSGTNTGDNAANSSTTYVGTTAIALNRASAAQALTGITSIDGNASTVTTNANLTGHVTSTGNTAVLGSFSSANLAGALTDETGSGASVFGTSPTFTTQITTPSIVSSGALGITPAAGSNLNVTLSTTGDFAVNTSQLYVDTSAGMVGIGTTSPGAKLDVSTGNIDIDLTTNANQYGVITKDGTRFIHDFNYGNNGTVTTLGLNTFVGKGAGNLTMGSTATQTYEGSYNTAVGNGALQANTTGFNNTANGMNSLYANTTGYSNTANGVNSLYANTTGFNNTANGLSSLYNNTTGFNNTANGLSSLYNNTTGNYNTANGMDSLYNNTTGNYNTANGMDSLYANTTGYSNTANGMNSLYANTTGYSNTANGVNSLYANTTGYSNTANGMNSLYANTTGYSNTALGFQSGYNSGVALQTNTNSVFVGDNANSSVDGLTNAIAIGSSAQATQSNQVVLGNSAITQTLLRGNVGVGTSTPTNILTLPIASATDPIADAWTVHCLGDYKDVDATTDAITLSNEALEKVKISKVSKFSKRATVDRAEVEKALKRSYGDGIKDKIKKDLEDYTLATRVRVENESYIDETIEGLWETKEGKDLIVDAQIAKDEAVKKLLPKFQRINYGLVAEDAPQEAQVYDTNGNLQGVDPYALIGLMWAAMQAQERRILLLEGK